MVLIPTFSPQGDGNFVKYFLEVEAPRLLIPTFSPQGDGNSLRNQTFPFFSQNTELIPTFSPQGDGNL